MRKKWGNIIILCSKEGININAESGHFFLTKAGLLDILALYLKIKKKYKYKENNL
jgi:hypothetical protein